MGAGETKITMHEAVIYIEKKLLEINELEKTDLVIDEQNLSEISTHWIIPYQSKLYLESGDSQYAIIGKFPYAVDKETGKIDPEIDTSWM